MTVILEFYQTPPYLWVRSGIWQHFAVCPPPPSIFHTSGWDASFALARLAEGGNVISSRFRLLENTHERIGMSPGTRQLD